MTGSALQERPERAEIALHYRDGRCARIDMGSVEMQFELDHGDRFGFEGFGIPGAEVRMMGPTRTTVTLTGYGETRFTLPAERNPPAVGQVRVNAWAPDERQIRDAELDLRQAQLDMRAAAERVRQARGYAATQTVASPGRYAQLAGQFAELAEQLADPGGPVGEDWYERDMERGRWLR